MEGVTLARGPGPAHPPSATCLFLAHTQTLARSYFQGYHWALLVPLPALPKHS